MTMLIENPRIEEELKQRRKALGTDQHDEVWDGVYFMPPMANDDHQDLVFQFSMILGAVVATPCLGKVRPGVNLAFAVDNWEENYRVPDLVVFRADTTAVNHDAFWTGAADFIIEITSPHDRTYDKIPFYGRIGVRELLIFNRQSRSLELYRLHEGALRMIGQSTLERSDILSSQMVPLTFRLIPGAQRPQIEVNHKTTAQRWIV